MAATSSVRIDSGPIEPTSPLRYVEKEKWSELVELRRSFLTVNLGHDCRCLVQFVCEAEEMWESLGYASADELIAKGYELELEEVRLAVRWLELNDPEEVVGLPELVSRAERTVLLAETVVAAKPAVGGRPAKVSEFEKQTPLPKGETAARRVARLKRDHPEIAARLAKGEFKSVAAAERASRGEEPHPQRKNPTPLEILKRAWKKASLKERQLFLSEIGH